ncbi:Schizosaccharomyces pombe specific protein [Schizosaccharomyces pombe]|uniref:Putative uncharacterized membrane protein C622.03c n=1 Tax=Schizosaccharomyces pombe (strain 972 / ATCC 24843) TaxID=284812 RepID=YC83_SCHPO|nr:uncharacterized protein SPCC622.03c [Schizosaccharomyces pombe]O94593.1 RecName: Full=Putative uncharacterized membrane protein C622.03c [Schizosaccharomyces pombe 972h-]CAA21859.1 hypothetical protein SPCC622.03c [Schizosaccharomyces pombe]|eukprot:NP_588175.1 uncharacterized protein [Schizosaccharomyces pombe]
MNPKKSIQLWELQSLLKGATYKKLIEKKTYEAGKERADNYDFLFMSFISFIVSCRLFILVFTFIFKGFPSAIQVIAMIDAVVNALLILIVLAMLFIGSRKLTVEIRRGEVEDFQENLKAREDTFNSSPYQRY